MKILPELILSLIRLYKFLVILLCSFFLFFFFLLFISLASISIYKARRNVDWRVEGKAPFCTVRLLPLQYLGKERN